MASVRDYIKIDPTEKRNKALGVIFPFNASAVFRSSYTTQEQVRSNLINVLLTEPGERVYEPNFGVGLKRRLFENTINETAAGDTNTQTAMAPISDPFSTGTPMETAGMPNTVANVVNRDYRSLMQAIDKKKGKKA